MNKYLSTGTATYTTATRTVAGATMSTAFASGDVGRTIVFRIGTALYWARVTAYVSATSVKLAASGSLPTSDGTIDELFLLDQGEAHAFADYVAAITTLVKGDDTTKLTDADIKSMLAHAVAAYGRDVDHVAVVRVAGDGTSTYLLSTALGAFWKYGKTQIRKIELPTGNVPPTYIDDDDWQLYDDGTAQDGSNVKLMLLDEEPAATEYFALHIAYEFSLPEVGTQNFPDTAENFTNIVLLASAHCCLKLAAAYAPSANSTISADVVNYSEKSDKYLRLARSLFERYNIAVFGSTSGDSRAQAAQKEVDIETRMSGGEVTYLFHGRNQG